MSEEEVLFKPKKTKKKFKKTAKEFVPTFGAPETPKPVLTAPPPVNGEYRASPPSPTTEEPTTTASTTSSASEALNETSSLATDSSSNESPQKDSAPESWEDEAEEENNPEAGSPEPEQEKEEEESNAEVGSVDPEPEQEEPESRNTPSSPSGASSNKLDNKPEGKVPAATTSATKAKKGTSGIKKGAKKKSKKKDTPWPDMAPVPDFVPHDKREHMNIVFIGHVDSGKSTISGQILLLTGHVDERTIAKYEKEAQEKKRESWYLAYIMDTAEEERAKGKTVEVGRASFETESKRYTLLDAPGHKNYVPNMIGGAAQADVGVLVISAREGEFEAGFDRGGQTREHAMLAKTLGIQRLIIMVNKMDTQADKSGKWGTERYKHINKKLGPFLKKCGFRDKDVSWIPVSGLKGINLKNRDGLPCDWYKGPCFMDLLDELPPITRDASAPLRIPLLARYKDMGTLCVIGKVESGKIAKGCNVMIMPTKRECFCSNIQVEETEVEGAVPGENVILHLRGVEEEDIQPGFVISHADYATKHARVLKVQLQVLELLPHKPLLTAGYTCVLHIHTAQVECTVHKLLTVIDKKTGKIAPGKPRFVKAEMACTAYIRMEQSVACESFEEFPQLGRFTLRDEGQTIAIGKILDVIQKKETAPVA